MGSFWTDNSPHQDFNLGGFQQQTPPSSVPDINFKPQGNYGSISDPPLSTLPQPSQQGPMSGGSPGGPIDFNDPSGIASAPESQSPWKTVGERNRALYGPGSPLGGANGMTDFGPSSWSFQPSGGGPGTLQGPTNTMGGFIQNQMNQNGGFYAPPPVSRTPQQPMNPSQQSGQVGMMSPDGNHFQYVNAEHVPHYQGLGATLHNGSSYGSPNGGF